MKTTINILLTCLIGSVFLSNVNAQSPADLDQAAHQRVAAKVMRVQEGAHEWKASGRDISAIAKTMEEKVKPLLEAGKFGEAETELDRVLELLKPDGKSTTPPTVPTEGVHQRVAAKVERLKQAVKKLAAGGGDPSAIVKTVEEKVKPLLDAGKFIEAEPELDRVLKMLPPDGKSTDSPTAPAEAVHQRVAAKVERITQAVQEMAASGRDPSAILKTMGEKVGPLLDTGKFVEAETELDRVLKALGLEPEPAKPSEPRARADAPSTPLAEAAHKRLPEKIERVKEGMQQWASSGRDPSVISQAITEKFKPLLDAGKFVEAEVELDRVLEQLKQDAK